MTGCNRKRRPVVLAVPDFHAPFGHRDAVAFLEELAGRVNPDVVVLMGDVADQHAFSRFPRNPSGMSGGHELRAARKQLAPLAKLFPKALVCWGNHDRRIYDRVVEVGIPEETIREMNDILEAPAGWKWADEWEVDGVLYEHGTQYTGKDGNKKAAEAAMGPVCIAHIHAHAGIYYKGNRRHLFWGFNTGCLIDHKAYAFAYAKRTPDKPVLGAGVIDAGIPRFVPMMLKTGGRWVGRL